MNRPPPRAALALIGVTLTLLAGGRGAFAQAGRTVPVEPAEVNKRADLIGREVEVDDRLARFQFHKDQGYDEIYLQRAPEVAFEIPPRLRPATSPKIAAVKVRGVLRKEGGRWRVEVNKFDPLPNDLERLNRGVASLPRTDTDGRSAWAAWAERRAEAFGDDALRRRAREVEQEAFEAEAERPGRDPAKTLLALAERAKARGFAEPGPSSLAHGALAAASKGAASAGDWKAIADKAGALLPDAKTPGAARVDLGPWDARYAKAPMEAYRDATADVRKALDRRLWADAVEAWLNRRAADDPKSVLGLADEAAALLPDRPALAGRFLEKGLATASGDVGALRLSEVEAYAKLYNETLHQPDRAKALYRAWLDDQRNHRLSPRDADGRLALADQYESLVGDREAAAALLQEAWKIDPESREAADAFRRRGYRKVDGGWVEASRGRSGPDARSPDSSEPAPGSETDQSAEEPNPNPSRAESLRHATPEIVRTRMAGKPNRRIWVASQGQLVEQWIYVFPLKVHYINFLRRPGDLHPRVVSFYSLPRRPSDNLTTADRP